MQFYHGIGPNGGGGREGEGGGGGREVGERPPARPAPVEYQVIIIYAATNKYLLDVDTADITRFESELFEFLDTKYPEIPKAIAEEKQISDATDELLNKAIVEFKEQFK